MWQARAALAALSTLASDGTHDELILSGCIILARRSEEEAKSIVGTALKALSKNRPERVSAFLQRDDVLALLDAPSLAKAAFNLSPGIIKRLKARRRVLAQSHVPIVDSSSAIAGGSAGSSAIVKEVVTRMVSTTETTAAPGVGGPGDPIGRAVRDPLGVGVTLGGEMTFGSLLEGHVEVEQASLPSRTESGLQERAVGTEIGMGSQGSEEEGEGDVGVEGDAIEGSGEEEGERGEDSMEGILESQQSNVAEE